MTRSAKNSYVKHAFAPAFFPDSRILILGSIPSPQSVRYGFYYSNPRNHFWPILANLTRMPLPVTPEEKLSFLQRSGIALWDVLASCRIRGASDSSIKTPEVNPVDQLLKQTRIHHLFTTGKTATELYRKYLLPKTGMQTTYLPSTSPANCANFTFEELLEIWGRHLNPLLAPTNHF
jgi:hypoxanthine-DNA glycosylase